jgi:hypothetical protein
MAQICPTRHGRQECLRLVIPCDIPYASVDHIDITFLQKAIPDSDWCNLLSRAWGPGVICPTASISSFSRLCSCLYARPLIIRHVFFFGPIAAGLLGFQHLVHHLFYWNLIDILV